MTSPGDASGRHTRPSALSWLAAAVLIVIGSLPAVLKYLVFWPLDQWQVDVEVYRRAGLAVLIGQPLYSFLTESPQLLPSTYPPFAALLAVPLAFLPFGVVGWLWTAAQIAATAAITWYAASRLIHRAGHRVPLALALLTIPMLWMEPVGDGIRFGQVNAFIVLACLMDLREPRPRLVAWVPRGVLVGLATAVKLVPGVFLVHFLICRRWKDAAVTAATAAGATILGALVLPEATVAFWGGALTDPARLGPNAGTSNQSIRGVLLRLGPDGLPGTLIWLVLAGAVGWFGFRLAARLYRAGDSIGEVAAIGLVANLISPVSWIHHFHWLVVVVFALLGAQPWRDRRRLVVALVITTWYVCRLPWWGVGWIREGWPPIAFGRFLQNADCYGAILALVLLAWVNGMLSLRRHAPDRSGSGAQVATEEQAAITTQ